MGKKSRGKRKRRIQVPLEGPLLDLYVELMAQATVAQMSPLEIGLLHYPTAKALALSSIPKSVIDDHLERYSPEELERGQFLDVEGHFVFIMDHEAKWLRDKETRRGSARQMGLSEDIVLSPVLLKLDAEALRRCLLLGAIPVEFAIDWADRRVDERDKPHSSLLDTAMSVGQAPAEIAACLARVPGEVESLQALFYRMFAWMHEALTADPERSGAHVSILYRMAVESDSEAFPERNGAFAIDEAFELSAPGGSWDRAEAERMLTEFLARFAVDGLRE